MKSAPDWLRAKPFAHRGLFDKNRPENSLTAIAAAIDAGFPVEIDAQVTADGRAVVFHDWNLQRLTGTDAKVVHISSSDLAKLRLEGTDEKIPLLEEALELVNGRQAILLEIKNRRYPTALEPVVSKILRSYKGPIGIQSFNPYTLGWFRLRHPGIPRGQLSCSFDTDDMTGWKKIVLEHYGMNWLTAPQFIAHHWVRLPGKMPAFLRRFLHLPLLAWTIRSPEEYAAAMKLADNVVFERFVPHLEMEGGRPLPP